MSEKLTNSYKLTLLIQSCNTFFIHISNNPTRYTSFKTAKFSLHLTLNKSIC